ncbi:MAG: hypothetical protein A3C07_01495 [Candidatus Sungbacteria bacterium RIFCSPHIGHO2_02_FULL_47_11]|uniref:Uncharacterized protein n=1 Tax=Candidatus Sungbacteria bacterium RIFCSPHIGHO2_02_FULL_47_11 TaxID=1802270 RepID=A0A1G2KM43_9BACT|nr:MAG: hypothetical protein A3C07_01495 [Candidatus Sungbacteria bacterium RIFCSPHIGHO2_02_FULL_47_11]
METYTATTKFKGELLNHVYRVWLFRKLVPVLVAEIVILSVVFYYLGRAVFVQRVFENALKVLFADPPQIVSFIVSTFLHTGLAVQILAGVIMVLLAFLVRHLTQGLLRLILVREDYFSKAKPTDH